MAMFVFVGSCVIALFYVIMVVSGLYLNKPTDVLSVMGGVAGLFTAIALFSYPIAFNTPLGFSIQMVMFGLVSITALFFIIMFVSGLYLNKPTGDVSAMGGAAGLFTAVAIIFYPMAFVS